MIGKPRRNVVIPTEMGMMMVNRFDYNEKENFPGVGHHLLNMGADNLESSFIFKHYLEYRRFPNIIDVGANIGGFTVQVSQQIEEKNGKVFAFEPQRQIFQMLNGNVALNSIDNVFTIQAAIGIKNGSIVVPKINYYTPGSFGSVGLTAEYDDVGQDLDFGNGETVPQFSIDSYFKDFENIDAIKVDVEGMEKDVIDGALEVIKKHRPLLYIEYLKQPNNGNDLAKFIKDLDYEIFIMHINFLCVPKERLDLPEYNFIKDLNNGN